MELFFQLSFPFFAWVSTIIVAGLGQECWIKVAYDL